MFGFDILFLSFQYLLAMLALGWITLRILRDINHASNCFDVAPPQQNL